LEASGEEIVVADAGTLKLGLSVCYDVRFPELFRIMAVEGARAFTLPSAFTVPTGRAHWEILIRARAIENQAFVIAAGQVGRHPPDHESYGHSMIVDAWGRVLAQAAEEPEHVIVADLDLDAQAEVRAKLPSLANRRPRAYRWPETSLVGAT
jgi:predicted amidohydrolase